MEIKLEEQRIQEAVSRTIQGGLVKSIEDWQFQEEIKKTVTDSFSRFGFFTELDKAIAKELQTNMSKVAQSVAAEVSKAAAKMAVATIREAMVDVVFKLRKSKYLSDEEERKLKEQIKFELFSVK